MGVLDGKAALVTGGSRGIGAAIAVRADQGAGPDARWLTGQNLRATGGMVL
jgi:NAD(P)-dependent dehydrogenase (short-subunit alcohol dehydrogenase family)